MGLISFLLNPVRYVLAQTMRGVFAEEVRANPIIVHAEVQSDDVGTSVNGSASARKSGYRKPREASEGFKPQYVAPLRPPRTDIEAQRLYNHIRTLAFYLDAIPFLGRRLPFNIGVDSIIGLIPGIGDYIGLVLSLYALVLSALFGIPVTLIGMMLFNIALDCALGFIPLVGDAFDVAFKANLRNLRLLEDHLIRNDGKCGSGTFCVVLPPSDVFVPKGKPPHMSMHPVAGAEAGRESLPRGSKNQKATTVAGSGNSSSFGLPDGTIKRDWVSTDAGGSSAGGTRGFGQDFRNGTTDVQGDVDRDYARELETRAAWSTLSVVPHEVFTTVRYEAYGTTLAHVCEPLVKLISSSKKAPNTHPSVHKKEQLLLWDRHLNRLQNAVGTMQSEFPHEWSSCSFDSEQLHTKVMDHVRGASNASKMRLRIAVQRSGDVQITSAVLSDPVGPVLPKAVRYDPVSIPVGRLNRKDLIPLQVKTGNRTAYDDARKRVCATLGMPLSEEGDNELLPCFDVLLNTARRGAEGKDALFLTETSIANIILFLPDKGYAITPSSGLPLLPGVLRDALLEHGLVREQDIQLAAAKSMCQEGKATLLLCNGLRGVMQATWVD